MAKRKQKRSTAQRAKHGKPTPNVPKRQGPDQRSSRWGLALMATAALATAIYTLPRGEQDGAGRPENGKPSTSPNVTSQQRAPAQRGRDSLRRSTPPTADVALRTVGPRTDSDFENLLNPSKAGWQTEQQSEVVMRQLELLKVAPETNDFESHLQQLVGDTVTATELRPATKVIVDRPAWQFKRQSETEQPTAQSPTEFAQNVARWWKPIGTGATLKFKVVSIAASQNRQVESRVQVSVHGYDEDENERQYDATWNCTWDETDGQQLLLTHVVVTTHRETTRKAAGSGRWLQDATMSVLADAQVSEFQVGMDDWVNRLDRRLGVSRFGHHGLAIADVNGDGLDDVYICQSGGLPNRLLLQRPNGTVDEAGAAAGLDFLDTTSSAIFCDFDNDGDQDALLAAGVGVVVLKNNGACQFEVHAVLPNCPHAFSLAVADYDADGLLDIYTCQYRQAPNETFELPLPTPYYDANNGGKNRLFRNLGEGNFEDVTDAVGLSQDNQRFSFSAAWEDYDNDGDVDLYVANDYGRNCLYEFDSGTFRNVAAQLNAEDVASGMSVSWADYNRDGLLDVYVSNMFSSAGNRIAFQPKFKQRFDTGIQSTIQRHARGNTLLQNGGAQRAFVDASEQAQVTMGRWAWGSLFGDINNDGWEDLLIANGLMTTDDTGDL